jgi:defect-in-organelle-trafficking protein DotB
MFDSVIIEAYKQKVSDVIVRTGRPILFKQLGILKPRNDAVLGRVEVASLLQTIHQNSIIGQLGQGHDTKFRYCVLLPDDSKIYCRCHATAIGSIEDDFGFELTVRLLNTRIPEVDEIDLPMEILQSLETQVGMMLISGPTGSGKSTSIACALQHHVKNHYDNIITFEDPMEFDFEGVLNKKGDIVQSEIPKHLTSFERAFSGSLRRAPDIIFWSEIRNSQAISNLTTSALTGHYVVSTVHTNSTELTLSRLIDSYPFDAQRAASVRIFQAIDTIMHQRLVLNLNNTGRTAIRSWCKFDVYAQNKLLNSINRPEELVTTVQGIMQDSGKFLIDDAVEKFKDGKLALSEYQSICRIEGTKAHLDIIPKVGDELVQRGLLEAETYKRNWISNE